MDADHEEGKGHDDVIHVTLVAREEHYRNSLLWGEGGGRKGGGV